MQADNFKVFSDAYCQARRTLFEDVKEKWNNRLNEETFGRYLENLEQQIFESEERKQANYANKTSK